MKKYSFIASCLIMSLILSGCATGLPVSYRDRSPQTMIFDNTKGYLYFYRPCVIWGAARGLSVFEGDDKIGSLNCSKYFIYEVNPGAHKFHAEDWLREEQVLTIDVQPGQKYFIKADLGIGIIDAVPSLTLMGSDESVVDRLKRVDSYCGDRLQNRVCQ